MKFCISSKAAKFFIEVLFVTTIVSLVRIESHIAYGPQDVNAILRKTKSYKTYAIQSKPSRIFRSFSAPSPNASPPASQETLSASSNTDTRKPLVPESEWISSDSRQVTKLLSPETLTHPDLYQYLFHEMSKMFTTDIVGLSMELDKRLKSNQISESVLPYARALKSIFSAVIHLDHARRSLKAIRNNQKYIPPEVASPPALSSYGFFSSDIIADPDTPLRLIDKLIEIPKSEIPNLIIQLKDYAKIWDNWGYAADELRWYRWYAQDLTSFLEREFWGKESRLEDLKRSKAEIQRISDSNRNSTIDGKMNQETGSSAT